MQSRQGQNKLFTYTSAEY